MDRRIERGALWPARSPDITDCDFLWGRHLKIKAFQTYPSRTIESFKQQIVDKIRTIYQSTCCTGHAKNPAQAPIRMHQLRDCNRAFVRRSVQ